MLGFSAPPPYRGLAQTLSNDMDMKGLLLDLQVAVDAMTTYGLVGGRGKQAKGCFLEDD